MEDATAGEWRRESFRILLSADTGEITRGNLVQIESASMLYLAEVLRVSGQEALVRVEHTVDRAKLAALEQIWG